MITHATPSDIPALAEMLRDLNAWHVPHAPHRLRSDVPHIELCLFFEQKLEEGAQILIYKTEGVARGYLMWLVQDRTGDAVTRPLRRAVLDHIYIEPVWRKRGLARRLIDRFEQEAQARECSGWITHVFAENAASQALMRGQGAAPRLTVLEKRYF